MNDYIKREDAGRAVLRFIHDYSETEEWDEFAKDICKKIQDIPAADVVEVVRCKDCKWWNGIECQTRDIDVVDDEEYCSYGERKEQEHEDS